MAATQNTGRGYISAPARKIIDANYLRYHLSDVPRLLVAAAALLPVHVAHGATAGDQRGSIRARQDVI